MDKSPGAPIGDVDDLLAELAGPAARAPDAQADLLSAALTLSERTATDDANRPALDGAVVGALRADPSVDAVLQGIEPQRLAALLERCTQRLQRAAPHEPGGELRDLTREVLDLVRRPAVLQRIARSDIDAWASRILAAVEASQFTVGVLFRQRARLYGSKVLFRVPDGRTGRHLTWRRVATRTEMLARSLIALEDSHPGPIALLSENRLELALLDLACLTNGLRNVMVPPNSTEKDVGFILRHSHAQTVIVSTRVQLRKVLASREALPELRHIVCIEPAGDRSADAMTWSSFLAAGNRVPPTETARRAESVRIDDAATIMYTSGTTGTPKAIQFSQRNLVFKRFARALALPAIGDNDTFLCFLPLCHTFGRFLEMLGCVFWGSTYCFLDSTSVESLIRAMQRHRPTVFISVPKKWIQLHEAITQRADPVSASDEELSQATRAVTGGALRWGLSAAGYLDPAIFRLFQRQGIELLSGFGMTEATGGITMTPPGEYRDDSLGLALPGIELRLAEDGELLVRGPYVMMGYLDPESGEASFDEDGWFPTGDLMQTDADGHLRLIDRKKEIYKNVKGETIAPQWIENLFRDMESVSRAFLVGDHREFNTLLIYANPSFRELDFAAMAEEEVEEYFRSLVVSVNKFLAPYERIVDFAVIDRDLDPERGELTEKGTPRRNQVARNFADVIRQLYLRTNLQIGGLELTIPNWLFQLLGLTAQDIRIGADHIALPSLGTRLTVERRTEKLARIGSCLYRHPGGPINVGALLTSPRLWLGNEELVDFVPMEPAQRRRQGRPWGRIRRVGREAPIEAGEDDLRDLAERGAQTSWDLLDLHAAARVLAATDESSAIAAIRLIERILAAEQEPLVESGRMVLARAADAEMPAVRRAAFQVLVPAEREPRFRATLELFLEQGAEVLEADTRSVLCDLNLEPTKVDAFIAVGREICLRPPGDDEHARLARALLDLLAAYGAAHPVPYRRLRAFLVRVGLLAPDERIRGHAVEAAEALQNGFRKWLGPTARIAVDPETGREYGWDDVVVFEDQVAAEDRGRLLFAIKKTTLLREAVFLFSGSTLIRLSDVPPGGVWIRLLGSRHGKSVYRVTIQTRYRGHHDLAVNVNHNLPATQVQEEIHWLILSGESDDSQPLVEDFGGYQPETDLWTEEFISGETLARAMKRLSRRGDESDRFQQLWSFLAWTALSAYVDFWHRSGKRWEIADPSMTNVVVPTDDYMTGVRIVSVSARRPHTGMLEMIRSFREEFVDPAERQYPQLAGLVDWDVLFSSVLEVVGEEQGLAMLGQALEGGEAGCNAELRAALERYIATVEVRGFLPRRLFFAAKRFRLWARLSGEATSQARARTLQELYDTYGLARLAQDYPEARVRFFRETVFRDSAPQLAEGLDKLIAEIRHGEHVGDELLDALSELRAKLELGPDDDYFLTRLSFPHLRPEDAADFVRGHLGGHQQSEIVVTLEDHDANAFRVRHAISPKEVERLHQLFLSAKLEVGFRPEHRYLVAINERDHIIGGIYYEIEEGGLSSHLEKIVVTERFRRKGVADGLMNDLFNRLRAAGVHTVTTGFFRPEYFYAYGFRIEKRYAGLVKSLDESPEG